MNSSIYSKTIRDYVSTEVAKYENNPSDTDSMILRIIYGLDQAGMLKENEMISTVPSLQEFFGSYFFIQPGIENDEVEFDCEVHTISVAYDDIMNPKKSKLLFIEPQNEKEELTTSIVKQMIDDVKKDPIKTKSIYERYCTHEVDSELHPARFQIFIITHSVRNITEENGFVNMWLKHVVIADCLLGFTSYINSSDRMREKLGLEPISSGKNIDITKIIYEFQDPYSVLEQFKRCILGSAPF